MLDALAPVAERAAVRIPAEHRRPVAIVGAGSIVDVAHLPAYARHGLAVRGIFDVDAARARSVAGRHGVPTVYASLDDLLADPEVSVVDIAVVPWAQPETVRAGLAAGKHLLCQKPFAPDVATGRTLVEQAEAAGLAMAVNQQLRFDEGIAAAHAMARLGWIGEVTTVSYTVDIHTDFSAWDWLVASDHLEIMYHSIHYLDAVRDLLGDPRLVFGTGSRVPDQGTRGETRTINTLVYDGDVRAVLHVNHNNRNGDPRAEFRIDGTAGAIRGTLGLLYDYPRGRPDTLEVTSRVLPTDGWLPYPVTGRWLPDAFAGPMAGLLAAIATGDPAPTAARDNLGTLALVHALYRSMDSGTAQAPEPA
ncbi:Gfo/Idh/MocA family protein [Plantactinospora sp. WMMC1484]|uniref:Gfo/Idh/MocA family protein n=1 Tax=Plantactinospora sp. WMMC1484 TaxID=3404122 RepID=UPI003BF5A91B